ncbi:hypothetical protein JMJ77_0006901 [Colletotrichum scovillei]|uniref:Uncharacterized protein n=1 Tax=Colletotrichum scovillei TaxID=1209932 RepID=A0A9P7RLS5_9PEZI|nr:hypothetical protein JMJ77_0006901 [Colletotrichum scovillei]KAG7078147.1 hypothetical protein JMJ76_0015381 [Colletotrichum scovillei]KAG7085258.1 hypothetical protein JMJ78_0010682 [Colletotrichum scovillei]
MRCAGIFAATTMENFIAQRDSISRWTARRPLFIALAKAEGRLWSILNAPEMLLIAFRRTGVE